ncbi:cupin domain-containing protein [Lacrimispora sp. 210928-DFI.3.58]|uniref:cupin domain-containing protein n=1 Tax=Lacrimispora sp. 210928-DFI.3.58 TaxID=2883214 RepID=UPI0015B391DD|nr:cupin domain-containing protein [Lacrimispora sp. 210928-DFI.3.58]MCB7317494.1 cupin domain-containing protein [Lacrimispora sp. 210928-DFI.3.58]
MEKVNIFDIEGMEFPAGRRTRVILGQNGAIQGEKFCQGYVVIYPGGGIPEHDHETVESYTILKGQGVMEVDGEKQEVKEGDYVFVPSWKKHSLHNTGDSDMHMMFVYAPSVIVDHWAQEQSGELK